jgi:hypothetical protein
MEEGLKAEEDAVGGVGDDGGKQGVDEDVAFELHGGVQHFDREDGSADGGAEDGRQAGGHADEDEESAFLVRSPGEFGVDGAEAGGNECGWAFASGRSTGADGDAGGNHFEDGNASADIAGEAMEGVDDGVRPVAFGLGRPGEDKESGDETADSGDEGNPPIEMGSGDGFWRNGIGHVWQDVAGNPVHKEPRAEIEDPMEGQRAGCAHQPQ